MIYDFTVIFLGFSIGYLLRGGISEVQRAKYFASGKAEGICEALMLTQSERKSGRVVQLTRAK